MLNSEHIRCLSPNCSRSLRHSERLQPNPCLCKSIPSFSRPLLGTISWLPIYGSMDIYMLQENRCI